MELVGVGVGVGVGLELGLGLVYVILYKARLRLTCNKYSSDSVSEKEFDYLIDISASGTKYICNIYIERERVCV